MIIYGKQCFLYTLNKAPDLIQEIYLGKEIDKKLFAQIFNLKKNILRLDSKKMQSLARGGVHQGFIAKIKDIELFPSKNIKQFARIVVLCGIMDIGNIGQIIRTCFALGVEALVISDINSIDTKHLEGMFKASSGALLEIPIIFSKNSLDIANELKLAEFTLIGSDLRCSSYVPNIRNEKIQKWVLFIGSEDKGLKANLIKKFDTIINIPMSNNFNSLNAGVAVGILIDRLNRY